MTAARRPFRIFGQNRIGVAILGLIALATMVASSMLFLRLLESERAMDALVREDAMWAVFQSDRHLRAFEHSVALILETGDPGHQPQMMHHYDILYSRVRLLERGTFVLDLNTDGPLSALGRDLRLSVVAMAGALDRLDPADPAYLGSLATLGADLPRLLVLSNDLVLAANAEISAARVRERDQRRALQDQLALLAMLGILAFVGIFVLLILQLVRIARSNQLMALLQERSRRRALRAQAASRAKSAFLATMSHEIRTPLNGIIGSTELLALTPLPAQQGARLETIKASAFLLRDLIDAILDFSKLEAGTIETRKAEVDLGELGRVLGQAFADEAARAGLTLDIRLPAARVLTNDARLRQVLVNLIGNAIKFTPRGGVRVRGWLDAPTLLLIEVEDDGIGIAPQDQARLFGDFIQLDGTFARQYGGTGLGLAICKRILGALGGEIGVDSALGQGSRFWFTLPVEPLVTPAAPPPAAPPSRPLTVLVVEDNEVNLTVVMGLLQHLGHRCRAARNGIEALDALTRERPDLIFMDMQMPLMDGVQATRELRKRGEVLPILGVTANALPEDRAACLAAGMDDFLPKPLTLDAVARAIARMEPRLAPAAPSVRDAEREEQSPGPPPPETTATEAPRAGTLPAAPGPMDTPHSATAHPDSRSAQTPTPGTAPPEGARALVPARTPSTADGPSPGPVPLHGLDGPPTVEAPRSAPGDKTPRAPTAAPTTDAPPLADGADPPAEGTDPLDNPQLADLIEVLGAPMVDSLIQRFEAELNQTDQALQSALSGGDHAQVDTLLHTFKGAALTLGLRRSGQLAQGLRQNAPLGADQRAQLVATTRHEIARTRHQIRQVPTP